MKGPTTPVTKVLPMMSPSATDSKPLNIQKPKSDDALSNQSQPLNNQPPIYQQPQSQNGNLYNQVPSQKINPQYPVYDDDDPYQHYRN